VKASAVETQPRDELAPATKASCAGGVFVDGRSRPSLFCLGTAELRHIRMLNVAGPSASKEPTVAAFVITTFDAWLFE
jgi:hypothetical protein